MAEKLNELVFRVMEAEWHETGMVSRASMCRVLGQLPEGAFVHELLAALEPGEVVG